MGFFKLLKKNKKSDDTNENSTVDFPPTPPEMDIDSSTKNEPSAESIPMRTDIPEVPDFDDDFSKHDLPDFDEDFEPSSVPNFGEQAPMAEKDIISQVNMGKEEAPIRPIEHTHEEIHMQANSNPIPIRDANPKGPIFITSENFQKVLGRIKESRSNLKNQETKLLSLEELKINEDKKHALWKNKVEDIQRKLIYIDRALFEEK